MSKNLVTGDEVIKRAFTQLGKTEMKKVMRVVTRKVAKQEVLPVAKSLAPVAFGALQDSLTVRSAATTTKKRGVVGASVLTRDGMFQGEQFYGGFQEFGWMQQTRDGSYPVKGNPFLRPALYNDSPKKMKAFNDASRKELKKVTRDLKLSAKL